MVFCFRPSSLHYGDNCSRTLVFNTCLFYHQNKYSLNTISKSYFNVIFKNMRIEITRRQIEHHVKIKDPMHSINKKINSSKLQRIQTLGNHDYFEFVWNWASMDRFCFNQISNYSYRLKISMKPQHNDF